MDSFNCQAKQEEIKNQFLAFSTPEERYEKVIEMGRVLPPFPKEERREENRIKGCQSTLYIKITLHNGKVSIKAYSDALISSGLAALLIFIYQDEPPVAIIQCPPLFLKEIGILAALSPGRSNGLRSLYQKMRQIAVELLAK